MQRAACFGPQRVSVWLYDPMNQDLCVEVATCRVLSDQLPVRSWALFKARDLMRHLIESLQADQRRCQVAP